MMDGYCGPYEFAFTLDLFIKSSIINSKTVIKCQKFFMRHFLILMNLDAIKK